MTRHSRRRHRFRERLYRRRQFAVGEQVIIADPMDRTGTIVPAPDGLATKPWCLWVLEYGRSSPTQVASLLVFRVPRFRPGDPVIVVDGAAWIGDDGPDVAGVVVEPPDGWQGAFHVWVDIDYGYPTPWGPTILHISVLRRPWLARRR